MTQILQWFLCCDGNLKSSLVNIASRAEVPYMCFEMFLL